MEKWQYQQQRPRCLSQKLAADFPTTGYIMTTFTNTLIGVGPICDANFTVVFRKEHVTVISLEGKPII